MRIRSEDESRRFVTANPLSAGSEIGRRGRKIESIVRSSTQFLTIACPTHLQWLFVSNGAGLFLIVGSLTELREDGIDPFRVAPPSS
jgi:hypothetical protein